jgi:glycosyltransferase involved in cell wall biosynthesis
MISANHFLGIPTFSICIPVHIASSSDLEFLKQAIESITIQKHVRFEILLSDDSGSRELLELVQEYNLAGIELILVDPPKTAGLGPNLNNCISHARNNYVKILFQDDFLSNSYSLLIMGFRLWVSKRKWLATATIHLRQDTGLYVNRFRPKKSSRLLFGRNSISSPSVILFKREFFLPFLGEMKYLIDCEWYLRMSHHFGLPVFFNHVCVINRLHKNQATHRFNELLESESLLARSLHDISIMGRSSCKCQSNPKVTAQTYFT